MFCQYVLLFVAAASVARVTCDKPPSPTYVIAHLYSEYVLDGREHQVTIQKFSGSESQYWIKEFAGNGKHFIKNVLTGKVLHIDGEPASQANVTTEEKNGAKKQQWYENSDNTIVSVVADNLALDIKDNKIEAGTPMIVYRKHGYGNQILRFENRTLNMHEL